MRRRRFSLFSRLLVQLPRPISILDVGGTPTFWIMMGLTPSVEVSITLLNTAPTETSDRSFGNLMGDARRMVFEDKSFDIVFSNSVIEHVGGFEEQRRMAQEVQRVGRRYFVQTPNRFFPIEPHFLFPFFQFLPVSGRVWLLSNFALGWFPKTPDRRRARGVVEGIRLLTRGELLELFPGGYVYEERLLGMVKSFVVFNGWQERR